MKNIIELRNELAEIFDQLKAKKIKMAIAKELVNTAGKIIRSVKLELDYAALRKETPIVEFLGGDEQPNPRSGWQTGRTRHDLDFLLAFRCILLCSWSCAGGEIEL